MSPELRKLIARVATHPHGLGFLHQADLDTVAVTLRVHPFLVAEARGLLEDPEGRARLIEEVRAVRALGNVEAPEPSSADEVSDQEVPAPGTVRELVRAARRHPLGLRFLLFGPFETVAVTFRVHPRLIFRARKLWKRRSKSTRKQNPEVES
jgi:hypothetical protein